jgi:uncharacterized membrane protein YozB (DUF420 family)
VRTFLTVSLSFFAFLACYIIVIAAGALTIGDPEYFPVHGYLGFVLILFSAVSAPLCLLAAREAINAE